MQAEGRRLAGGGIEAEGEDSDGKGEDK